MTAAQQLRALVESGRLIQAPGAADALTARLVEQAGFEAIYMTGFGATAARLGMPDIGLMSQTEMTDHARNMVRATTQPVIADADTGYGGLANLTRTVEEYVGAGVAAIHLEDQQLPKRCGQRSGIKVIETEENIRRLQAAVQARGSATMLLIARTDALPVQGVEAAITRAKRYRDAGADLVFVDGIKRIAEVEAVSRGLEDCLKVVSIVDGNETVALRAADLQQMGFSLAFYALSTLFSAVKAMQDTLAVLKADGSPAARADAMVSYDDFAKAIGVARFDGIDHDFGWPM